MMLPFHPLADFFPLMVGKEFKSLVNDIRDHGLREPIVVLEGQILDGRNRARACHDAGVEPKYMDFIVDGDPAAYVISTNIHRRHLTVRQRRTLAAKLLKADPSSSDRRIAAITKVSDKTAGAVRRDLEGRAEIPHVGAHTDTKGRKQPAKKKNDTHRPQLAVPPGIQASDWCRRGLALEAEGATAEGAAKQIGAGVMNYRKMRDIVMLTDRVSDLSATDAKTARDALALLNNEKRAGEAHDLVQAIVARVWGGGPSPRTDKSAARVLQAFDHAMTVLIDMCERAAEIAVPQLSKERAEAAVKEIGGAKRCLDQLKHKIEEMWK